MRTPWILKFGKDNLVELIQRQELYPQSAWEHRVKSGPDNFQQSGSLAYGGAQLNSIRCLIALHWMDAAY